MSFKRILLVASLIILALYGVLAIYLYTVRNKYDAGSQFKAIPGFTKAPLYSFEKATFNDSNLVDSFPYAAYQSSSNWRTLQTFTADVAQLDAMGIDSNNIDYVVSEALTTRLTFWSNTIEMDSLLLLMNWAEELKHYSKANGKHAILYQAIGDYWIGEVDRRLSIIASIDPYASLNGRYAYLRTKICQHSGGCGDRLANSAKVIQYLTEGKWSYVARKLWSRTGLMLKIGLLASIMITILAYIALFKVIFIKK
ncbi:MAG: hypothetical protein ACO3O0_00600 [Bacteroidia bacterium]|jgi:hypothetical protein